jgi:hypothetical protein
MYIKEVLQALQTQIKAYTTLSYLSNRVYICEDILELCKGDTPFVNIDVDPNVFKVDSADEVRDYDMERHIYTVNLQFATQAASRDLAVLGSTTIKGILDVHSDLYSCLRSDVTLGGKVYGINRVETLSRVFPPVPEEGILYLAGCDMTVSYWRDISNR